MVLVQLLEFGNNVGLGDHLVCVCVFLVVWLCNINIVSLYWFE